DPDSDHAVVGNYMAHHIGMSLAALTNVLGANVWQRRFHADPLVRSAELLLHERIPRRLVLHPATTSIADATPSRTEVASPAVREFTRPDSPRPHVALLGRLPYFVMVTHAGSGFAGYRGIAVTRWRADGTTDAMGQFCYVRDVTVDRVWSAAHQPVCAPADSYNALLDGDRVTFHRTDGDIETRTEITVVPDDAAEVRIVTVTNHGSGEREVELTSYAEVVIGPADADRAHPAFANLFVETEWHEWCAALTATRRPRSAAEPSLWCVHVMDAGTARVEPVSYETDRARFSGRGRTTRAPAALDTAGPLSNTTGAVLDPIFALRTRLRLEPGESATVTFTTLVAPTRAGAFELADRYHDPRTAQRALDLAWTSQQVELRDRDMTPADAALYQDLAGCLLYPHPDLRATPEEIQRNHGAQPLLWSMGISGDRRIVLATIDGADGLPTLRQVGAAHHFWRRRGLLVDLVILFPQATSYLKELHDRIMETLFAIGDTGLERPGGVYLRNVEALDADALLMLRASARMIIPCDGRPLSRLADLLAEPADHVEAAPVAAAPRSLERQAEHERRSRARHPAHPHPGSHAVAVVPSAPVASAAHADEHAVVAPHRNGLMFDNGLGGLAANGDYVIRVSGDGVPPAPWVNVIAHERGGFIVSERGAGCTWAASSYFFRLTPWHNDPVSDPISDVLYLQDEVSRDAWSATPAPLGHGADYRVTHSTGTSVFEAERNGIATRLTLGMAADEPVRLSVLRVTNHDVVERRIRLTAFVEWTLGTQREKTQHHVRTLFDPDLGALLARNYFDPQFHTHVAFCALSEPVTGHTADRREFLGRNGSVQRPAALRHGTLTGATGTGLDPCAALQCVLVLAPGQSRDVVVALGAATTEADARRMASQFRNVDVATAAAARTVEQWQERLSVITVRTPDPAFDAMLNRWLPYQTLACRMWARSAVYQSSGAYGFRDQLQDALTVVHAEPAVARAQVVRAAARQFPEGDVQHWWHPHTGAGVRTRFSDDLAWMPYVTDEYVVRTGDASVLDEYVPFLTMRTLE
ncbi:MAG TPA: hypothetical protein VK928_04480, partial [Longimicrobiales bacterium]|nr:hypothetical protein [Longimicrobiales bacterium]